MCFAHLVLTHTLFLLLPILARSFHPSIGIATDQSALLEFKKGVVADPQNALSNWNQEKHVCDWNGVNCSTTFVRVTKLDLKGKYLQGTISPFLSNLSGLILLELSDNSFQGPIPPELGTLANLELLSIEGNGIQYEIPGSFSKLSELRYINLRSNQLHGNLPASLFYNCTQLSYIDLSDNSFTGRIPLEIGNHLLYLENLLLYLNLLSGGIPPSLSNSTLMVEIDLENNFLSGVLPSTILIHMPSLEVLHLSYNNFSSDEQNTNLNHFFDSIANLTHLKELELAGNCLGGVLPATVGILGINLSQIYLQNNFLYGEIPSNISSLSNLMELNLSDNLLSGTIPSEIILLPNLQRLWLSNNLLSGKMISPPGVVNNLGLLDLSRNKISGAIPASLGYLIQLRTLILYGNLLSGPIPPALGNMKLELLDLSHNKLTGTLPREVASLTTMQIYFNLSDNLIGGVLPMELSNMDKVRAIDLSSNVFSGKIPPNLGGCEVVELVNLSHNRLEGPIPGSLGNLLSLQALDLSANFLSGEIPSSLEKCTTLKQLNLSFNNFSGPLPRGGIFDSLMTDCVEGNRLCGSLPGIPSCDYKKGSMIHSRTFLCILVSIVSLSAFTLTIICVLGYRKFFTSVLLQSDSGATSTSALDMSTSYPRITYRELVEATAGFNQSRLLGSGCFGNVYKGVMADGSAVAVKVLQVQTGKSTNRSFIKECQVLETIRHRNLIRIITVCSLPDFKALVLPFMSNGSLENYLYPNEWYPGLQISLVERVNICCDVAEGMAYLHHYSPVQVIHCDLKPSNILLNDDMTALVSDFGTARLVMTAEERTMMVGTSSNSTANLLSGSIGYIAPGIISFTVNNL